MRRGVSLQSEHTRLIAIKEFSAEFSVIDGAGLREWCACTVVGMTDDENSPRFVVIVDDGGVCYAMTVDEVRRAPAASV